MVEPTHELMRSTMKPDMQGDKIKQMKFNLFVKKIPVCLIAYHNIVTRFTRISLHKFSTVVRDKKLLDRTLWPVTLVCTIGNVQLGIRVKYSPKKNKYRLKVNKVDFFDLPFRASTFNSDQLTHRMSANIELNGQRVLTGSVPWSIEAMRDRFNKVLKNGYMTSFSIADVGWGVKVSESAINELIDLIAMQETHSGRFNQITFSGFYPIVGALDEGTLDRLVDFSKNLTKLTVSYMYDTSS